MTSRPVPDDTDDLVSRKKLVDEVQLQRVSRCLVRPAELAASMGIVGLGRVEEFGDLAVPIFLGKP